MCDNSNITHENTHLSVKGGRWIDSDSDSNSKMTLEENRTRKGEMCCVVYAGKTGVIRNLMFSEAVWKQICPEICYNCVLLECCL